MSEEVALSALPHFYPGATKIALPTPYQRPQKPANTTTGKATSVASKTTSNKTLNPAMSEEIALSALRYFYPGATKIALPTP